MPGTGLGRFLGFQFTSPFIRHPYTPGSWRTRQFATATVPDGPPITETNRAEATLKRFWKTVGIDKRGDVYAVTLDQRPLKTPGGKTLLLPESKVLLATLIAHEWATQETLLKPHVLPMTSLASRAIDALGEDETRAEVRASLLKYLDTDTICFYQDEPPPLVVLQEKLWDPLLNWARSAFDVEIQQFDSILSHSQPEATKRKFDELLSQFDPWEMAAMERATYTTKSFIVALALVKRQLTAEQAAETAQVEVNSQIERWGEVEDSRPFYVVSKC